MAPKPSSALRPETLASSTTPKISTEIDPQYASKTLTFLKTLGLNRSIPDISDTDGFYPAFIRSFLKVDRIQRGRIACTVFVRPPISNFFETLHGGGLAAVVELIAIACARTVVGEDKGLFLGEMSMSYLSGAPINLPLSILNDEKLQCYLRDESTKEMLYRVIVDEDGQFNAEVLADASVEKSGRNLTAIGLEFKLKQTGKLIYTARATFYNLPVAKL